MARVCWSIHGTLPFLLLAITTFTILKLLIDLSSWYNSSITNDTIGTRYNGTNEHETTQDLLRSYRVNSYDHNNFKEYQPHDSNIQNPRSDLSSKSWLLDNQNILSDEPVSDDLMPNYFNLSVDMIPQFERHLNETKSIMKNRLQNIQQQCVQKSKHLKKALKSELYIFPELNMAWCPVFKAGSTNWKQFFCKIYKPDVYYKYLEVLDEPFCPLEELLVYKSRGGYKITGVLQFLTVRHPYERLVSVYTNKFKNCDSPIFCKPKDRMVHILEDHRDVRLPLAKKAELIEAARLECNKPSKDRVIDKDNPYMNPMGATFREFIEYVVKGKASPDFHWSPMFNRCDLCIQDYDIIEKFETLERDHYFLLKMVGEESRYPDIAGAHANPSRNSMTSTRDKIMEYFSTLNEQLLWGLQFIYKNDFDLFGYNPYFRVKQKPY